MIISKTNKHLCDFWFENYRKSTGATEKSKLKIHYRIKNIK